MGSDKVHAVPKALADAFGERDPDASDADISHAAFDQSALSEAFRGSHPNATNTEHRLDRLDHALLFGTISEALPPTDRLPSAAFYQSPADVLSERPPLADEPQRSRPDLDPRALSEMFSEPVPVSTGTRIPLPSFDQQTLEMSSSPSPVLTLTKPSHPVQDDQVVAEMLAQSHDKSSNTWPSCDTGIPFATPSDPIKPGKPLSPPYAVESSTRSENAGSSPVQSVPSQPHEKFTTLIAPNDERNHLDPSVNQQEALIARNSTNSDNSLPPEHCFISLNEEAAAQSLSGHSGQQMRAASTDRVSTSSGAADASRRRTTSRLDVEPLPISASPELLSSRAERMPSTPIDAPVKTTSSDLEDVGKLSVRVVPDRHGGENIDGTEKTLQSLPAGLSQPSTTATSPAIEVRSLQPTLSDQLDDPAAIWENSTHSEHVQFRVSTASIAQPAGSASSDGGLPLPAPEALDCDVGMTNSESSPAGLWEADGVQNAVPAVSSQKITLHAPVFNDAGSLIARLGKIAPAPARSHAVASTLLDTPATHVKPQPPTNLGICVSTSTISSSSSFESTSLPLISASQSGVLERPANSTYIDSEAENNLPSYADPLLAAISVLKSDPSPPHPVPPTNVRLSVETLGYASVSGTSHVQPPGLSTAGTPTPVSLEAKSLVSPRRSESWHSPVSGQSVRDGLAELPVTSVSSCTPEHAHVAKAVLAEMDLETAIRLRWVMRDIKSSRTKFSPVSADDLAKLVNLGFVQLRGEKPCLTALGVHSLD